MSVGFKVRRSICRGVVPLAITALAFSGLVHAQTWPTKPVRLVVPVGAGGTTDIVARAIGQALQQSTGQPFVVDLKPGANGAIGSIEVMRQPPDGYTLLVGTASTHGISPAVMPNLGYTTSDFTPIGLLADSNVALLVSPKLGVKSVKELIELAKAKPGYLNYYSSGAGSYTHFMSALLELQAKVKLTHIPYKGFAQAIPDMISGTTHVAWDSIPSSLPYVKDGRLVALAVSGPKRSTALPDLPTMNEALAQLGLPGFSSSAWFGLFGPRGMSPELTRRINEEVNKVLRSPEIQSRFTAMGLDVVQTTPAEFNNIMQTDVERWRRIAREANIKVQE